MDNLFSTSVFRSVENLLDRIKGAERALATIRLRAMLKVLRAVRVAGNGMPLAQLAAVAASMN